MNTKERPWSSAFRHSARAGLTATLMLALPVAVACEPVNEPQTANSASSGPQRQVIACYAKEYSKKQGSAPKIDDNERKAADDLLAKYGGQTRRACGAVTVALSGPLCNMPVSLASVVACERAHGRPTQGPTMDTATKSEIEQRINEQDHNQNNPGQFSY